MTVETVTMEDTGTLSQKRTLGNVAKTFGEEGFGLRYAASWSIDPDNIFRGNKQNK